MLFKLTKSYYQGIVKKNKEDIGDCSFSNVKICCFDSK